MNNLKPCPFCGVTGTLVCDKGNREYTISPKGKRVACHNPECPAVITKTDTDQEHMTIEEWNTRTTSDAGLGTADRIARAMLDDSRIDATETMLNRYLNLIPFGMTICTTTNMLWINNELFGVFSPATAALCRARWEAMRKEKQ